MRVVMYDTSHEVEPPRETGHLLIARESITIVVTLSLCPFLERSALLPLMVSDRIYLSPQSNDISVSM